MGHCCTRAPKHPLASVRTENSIYLSWRNYALAATALLLLLIYVTGMLANGVVHLWNHYESELRVANTSKTQGEEIWAGSGCASKPMGYKSLLLDCGLADRYRNLNPHWIALESTLNHFWHDDASLMHWINRCHNGKCEGFLWFLAEAVILHYPLVIGLWTLAAVVVLLSSGSVYWRCLRARRKAKQVQQAMDAEPRRIAQRELIQRLQDTQDLTAAIHNADPTREDVRLIAQTVAAKTRHACEEFCATQNPTAEISVDTDGHIQHTTPHRRWVSAMKVLEQSPELVSQN